MNKTSVYDLPTRLFHGLFAGLFVIALLIAKNFDDDSPVFAYHMLAGFTLVFVVMLRVLWGVIGSQYARFSTFSLNPLSFIAYFKSFFGGKTDRTPGHNSASSWAAIVMMALTLALGFSGYMMTQNNNKEFFEDIHELLANAFMIVAILHVAGIVIHTLKHRDGIGLSMITGEKENFDKDLGIAHSYKSAGIVFLALTAGFVLMLKMNFNTATQSLNLFGNTITLGESEDEDGEELNEDSHSDDDGD